MLLRDLRIYSFGFPIEERVLISNWLPISQYVTSRLSKNKEHWYNQEILHATTAPKRKGFGFHTDRKSFHCYVALNLNFNICIKKKKRTKKQEEKAHPQESAVFMQTGSWVYTVISADFITSFREAKLAQQCLCQGLMLTTVYRTHCWDGQNQLCHQTPPWQNQPKIPFPL